MPSPPRGIRRAGPQRAVVALLIEGGDHILFGSGRHHRLRERVAFRKNRNRRDPESDGQHKGHTHLAGKLETKALRDLPDAELDELAAIYREKGLSAETALVVVLNWFEELKQRVGSR